MSVRIVLELSESGVLNIGANVPPEVVLGVVTSAWMTLLSQKIKSELAAEARILIADGDTLRRLPPKEGDV